MQTPARWRRWIGLSVVLVLTLLLAPATLPARTAPAPPTMCSDAGPAAPASPDAYPPDPTSDISWSAGTSGVSDVQAAFNAARTAENNQLGTSLPAMSLPSQSAWDAMSDGEKALWLINEERVARGVMPLHGLESNVTGVAQYYAEYLLDNDAWGHNADGRSPWGRLDDNPAIGACHDGLSVAENIAVFVTSGSSIALPVERSVFMWLYDDGDCCGWGHRHAILWYPYNDNSGPAGREGFLGIGRDNGGPYQGPFKDPWPFAEMIVMNVFDPCASWAYAEPSVTAITPASGMRGALVNVTDLAGQNFATGATVTLTRTGEADIVATDVTVVSESRITCDLDLSTAALGAWYVSVANPDGQAASLPDGFTVTVSQPSLSPLPDRLIASDEAYPNALDLWAYARDPYYAAGSLTYTITNSPVVSAGVSLHDNRYIDMNPVTGWSGQTDVTIQVQNPDAQTASDTFAVTVVETLREIYLPVMVRKG